VIEVFVDDLSIEIHQYKLLKVTSMPESSPQQWKLCCQQHHQLTSLAGFAMSLKAGTAILYTTGGAAGLVEYAAVVIEFFVGVG
jgi:hypothetical protein